MAYTYWSASSIIWFGNDRHDEQWKRRRGEDSPDLTKWAVSSCIKVMGRPRNPFCWDTPGNVPTLRPEISCWQCNVAAADISFSNNSNLHAFFVLYPLASCEYEKRERREQEKLIVLMKVNILWASHIVATPLMRYRGIVEGPASPSIIVVIDRNTVLGYRYRMESSEWYSSWSEIQECAPH